MERIFSFKPIVEDYIRAYLDENQGPIYQPVKYITELGGKRLRPCLLMAVGEAMGAAPRHSTPLAAALEIFHNFTLLHDDIMDQAETRRGEPSVHVKWNRNQAILSGDIMFAMSYELLIRSDLENIQELHSLFSNTAKEVCIGQQMDMDFETRTDVSEEEYLEMIRLKTSVLIGTAAAMGAMAAQVGKDKVNCLYSFGQNLGLSFQIQDDILDAFGQSAAVGKRIGGDIINNKKTLLILKALELTDDESRAILQDWYSKNEDSQAKIDEVKRIIKDSGSLDAVQGMQNDYLQKAVKNLQDSGIEGPWYDELYQLILHQLKRSS